MTTSVTIKTHTWPAMVTINDSYSHSSPTSRGSSWGTAAEFVPANSERKFHVTNSRSLTFTELPADATELPGGSDPASF